MFVKEGIYRFPLFSDDNFALTYLLLLPLIPFLVLLFANFFHEITRAPVGRGSSFRGAFDNVGLVRSLLPGVPSIVVIVTSAIASPTTQTRAEDQLKMTAPARVIASPFPE